MHQLRGRAFEPRASSLKLPPEEEALPYTYSELSYSRTA